MVSKIEIGERIKGALNYNEKKVSEGKAQLLFAGSYLEATAELNFNRKLLRLQNLADRNERSRKNCIHISLNFDPTEALSDQKMTSIASSYMSKIGFGGQPYLVYRHEDSGHPHLHIVTTSIRYDGTRIPLHNIGKSRSEPARKEIEKEFGLIQAEGRGNNLEFTELLTLEKPIYGKVGTKAAISNIVRRVVNEYKYTTFSELNTVLENFNITAYRGNPDSKMYSNRGLTYFLLDQEGNKTGIPIKASSIYSRPTLNKIEENFEKNKQTRLRYKDILKKSIDIATLSASVTDRKSFKDALIKEDISVIYHKSDNLVYGMTFIDHKNKTVFKSSELGMEYKAKRILERLNTHKLSDQLKATNNKMVVQRVINETDYHDGVYAAIANWYRQGLIVEPVVTSVGSIEYYAGSIKNPGYLYVKLDGKYEKWLKNNDVPPALFSTLNISREKGHAENNDKLDLKSGILDIIRGILSELPEYSAPSINPAMKKKKRKRKNW